MALNGSKTSKKGIAAWCVFDWAHSAFPTVITTFVFSTYFLTKVAPSKIIGTEYWGWALAAAGITVAIIAPILGATADQLGRKKPWLFCLTLFTVVCVALLWFTKPEHSYVLWALILFALADVGYEFTQIFYNALLIDIAPKHKVGRISGWGWGTGYFGGLLCLIITLFVFIKGTWLPTVDALNVRAVTLFVAIWFAVFALPIFIWTPDRKSTDVPVGSSLSRGLKDLWKTFSEVRKHAIIFRYLIAHLIYIDGVNTLLAFGGIYAAGTFHMSFTDILYFGIILNVAAGIGAISMAWVDDWLGAKFIVCLSLIALIIATVIIILTHSIAVFWAMGIIVGLFCGPVQAASRSYMVHLTPHNKENEMFGIYALSGRLTAFIGPFFVGTLTAVFNSQRYGVAIIVVMMLIGLFIMFTLPKIKIRKNQSLT